MSLTANAAIRDTGAETFAVPEAGTAYYVNDASTAGDGYASAAGTNRATGKVPSSPLPLPNTALRRYAGAAGSTVSVDTGMYSDFAPIVLSDLGSGGGASVVGPTHPQHVARVNLLGSTTAAVVDVNDGNFTSVSNLTLSGGGYGLWVHNGSGNFAGNDLTATINTADGFRFEAGALPAGLDHVTATLNGGAGIFVNGPIDHVRNGTVAQNGNVGVTLTDAGAAVVQGLTVHDNAAGCTSVADPLAGGSTVSGNAVYDNGTFGISTVGNVLVFVNAVYRASLTAPTVA